VKIRNKLAVLFAVIVASILLVFSLVVYISSAKYRQREFYARLEEKAFITASILFEVKEVDVDERLLRLLDEKQLTSLAGEEVTIYDEQNKIIYDSGHERIPITNNLLTRIRSNRLVKRRDGERETLGVLYRYQNRSYAVLVSAIDRDGNNKLQNLAIILLLGCTTGVLLVIMIGWIFAGKALEPITGVIHQVDRITASNLNMRVDTGNGKDEIAQLALIFNRMLARLEEAFLVQKSFVSNASHEIRTPLTVITGQIEVTLLQERSPEEYRSVLQSVLEDVLNLTQLSNGLLELAQASADVSTISFQEVRVDELLWQARAELLKKRPAYSVQIAFDEMSEDEKDFTFQGNGPLLKTAFLNLMENGCKFSVNKQMHVNLNADQEQMVIRFTDNGLGIDEKDIAHIFEPFYRSENTKNVAGHGVGLALTDKIISLHQGSIEVISKPHHGTTFVVSLPHRLTPSLRVNEFADASYKYLLF
jgi:signal transduction histidine kinase